ncbi:50S ribosomal protein L18e [Candidatus Micrarchaeota archaeon]|nr:50S ribosomal protein L18e [Candidatus Micrarchaeota archaeon]
MHERKDLNDLIERLRKEKKRIWKRTAELLSRPNRRRVEVNVSKIESYGLDGTTILIPGKVLGSGKMSKKLTIAAFSFSEGAKKAIAESGSKIIGIEELANQNPEGKSVIILV